MTIAQSMEGILSLIEASARDPSCPAKLALQKKRMEPADQLWSTICLFLSVICSVSSRRRESGHWYFLVCVQEGSVRSEGKIELVSSTLLGRRSYAWVRPICQKQENTVCD